MQRKLIRQGGTGLTFYVPKKWIDAKGLKAGDEIEITSFNDDLLLSTGSKKHAKREIHLTIKESTETAQRTLLVNAYRAGFDRIIVAYEGEEKDLRILIDTFMLGFELFKEGNTYIIESVSEPSYENFENIIVKQFYLIEEILKDITNKEIKEHVHKIQKYDNFLKRCLSKEVFSVQANMFLWQFLSYISQIARLCLHFHDDITSKLDKNIVSLVEKLQEMAEILKNSYLKKDFVLLTRLHKMNQEIIQIQYKCLTKKNALYLHHILLIARIIYIANSPLMGLLQLTGFSRQE